MREPVRRKRLHRQKTAEQLVLALRAALEALEAAGDGEFDRLVVATFEVQERHMLERAPVAAVECLLVVEEQRAGDGTRFAFGDDHRYVVRQRCPETAEKRQVQIGVGAVRGVGAAIAAVEELPIAWGQVLAEYPAQIGPGFPHATALLADVLASRMGQAREKALEVGITFVAPVELHGAPEVHALRLHHLRFVLFGEENMQRGAVLRELQRSGKQRSTVSIAAG